MPGRQSHGRPPTKKPKVQNKSKKRAIDAFSIASHENPDRLKVKQHRLGAQEGGNRPNKRRRNEEDEDDGEEAEESKSKKPRKKKGRFDELDVDEGSDSEGHEWKLGQVDSDDDSDLDSDEAFGESDEERFEGYAFSGSSDKKSKKNAPRSKALNLDEDDVEESDSELEEGDLGEDAVDLATMLDMASDEDEDMEDEGSADSDSDGSEESDAESSMSSADEDDETSDPAKLAALQNMIANLPQADDSGRSRRRGNEVEGSKLPAPAKLTLEDMMSGITDPHDKKALKFLESASGSKKARGKLEVPLAKRQQDRLDRSAAYDKTKETLDRWTDTVKHNRRADHLMFPLPDNEALQAKSNKELVPTNISKPFNELEATIQSILEESGLAAANGKDDEDHIREFEELQTNKLSMEDIKARRDQLRAARELLFREEAKAKRIKKIKSKSYRKVHRKQREKEERLNQEALAEGGYVPSEDELEAQDRRRAEERMGAKHRGSKWAKSMKETGQTTWNEDARSGITEMARRDEELRKRVEGRAVRKEFNNNSDEPFDESDDMSDDDDAAEQNRQMRELADIGESGLIDDSLPGARLANMDFMRKADAARKKQNADMVEEMRRELAGEDTPSEEEVGEIGRRAFGPGNAKATEKKARPKSNEFEERDESKDDEAAEIQIHGTDNSAAQPPASRTKASKSASKPTFQLKPVEAPATEGGAWSKVPLKSSAVNEAEAKRRRHKKNNAVDVEELDLSQAAVIASKPKSKKVKKKSTTLEVDSESEDSDDDNAIHLPFAIRDQELIKRAFAGADVVGEFEKEKKKVIKDQDDKVVDDTLPGWGSWVGDGLSKKERSGNKGKVLRKVDGIRPHDRKDAKLDRVIINEKRVKKNNKYLASSLPHTYETKQQYERSLRLPIGPEWTTKETFQDATKPRVLLKQGIIAPMSKPLL
ncbi:related to large nucleolar U3 ribonucleoprotein [Phialocephala subalpina]|uniref:Related to large nucleolar U3 ribonucleoprotein n=1 Tax=Phialocephala subalpina TaxID=576137 RepID=A0A1L7WW12_9HELO|nr:related to large nucleolar U3 ribonucleoprotein [Phialocephala subalpina]